MDKRVKTELSISLASLVNSHVHPFVVIDRDYRIVASNSAYERQYAPLSPVECHYCYKVSHGRDRPCHLEGEECPHQFVFANKSQNVCMHFHYGADHHMHQVQISAFPIHTADGQLLMGECIEEVSAPNKPRASDNRMVGESPAFLACLQQMNLAASSDAPVLLLGETGTGKELAAEYIHNRSSRSNHPLQIVDSTVLNETLFEAEVFGHVRGAYTGSIGEKLGLFELADGGSLFLDEVGDLPLTQQAKLLRVLESGQFRRVGGTKVHTANVRIICATNHNLWSLVEAGKFREDLFYRIACLTVKMPPLRERMEDVPWLARSLMESINRSMRFSCHLLPDVYARLQAYSYPGNIRELRNILFIAATHSVNREINAALIDSVINSLPHSAAAGEAGANTSGTTETVASVSMPARTSLEEPVSLKSAEAQHIKELLLRYHGNRKLAAGALGISERTLYRKLKRFGLN